jgi:fructose-bisphosphate aldolase class II
VSSRPDNVATLAELLPAAQAGGYAVGSFSPRYPLLIPTVLRAGQALGSPLIVQISQKDMSRCGVEVSLFAEAFYRFLQEGDITVPVVLHLDHTEDERIIAEAIAVGFSSVMIDASHMSLEGNIATTKAVVDYGHACGVSVEGELGTIGAYSFSETDMSDDVRYTDPDEIERFARETQVDAVAVSVGTVHGVKAGTATSVDLRRLTALRARTGVPLVLHGGSGIPAEMMWAAIALPGGGVSKVNLATDLELAMLAALESKERLVNTQVEALSPQALERAQAAVEGVVSEKIRSFLLSEGRAQPDPTVPGVRAQTS